MFCPWKRFDCGECKGRPLWWKAFPLALRHGNCNNLPVFFIVVRFTNHSWDGPFVDSKIPNISCSVRTILGGEFGGDWVLDDVWWVLWVLEVFWVLEELWAEWCKLNFFGWHCKNLSLFRVYESCARIMLLSSTKSLFNNVAIMCLHIFFFVFFWAKKGQVQHGFSWR